MNSAPWWFLLVTAVVSGGIAMLATWLTTRHTNRQGNERLRIELEHQRDLERRKLLFDHRAEIYDRVAEHFKMIEQVPVTIMIGSPFASSTLDDLADSIESLDKIANRAAYMASKRFYDAFIYLVVNIKLLYANIGDRNEGDPPYDEDEELSGLLEDFTKKRDIMFDAMRQDVGAVDD